jgi:uncharacterized membrane protein
MDEKIKIDKKRHLLKAITWRILASIITFIVTLIATFFMFGEAKIEMGLTVGIFDFIIKFVAYYFHERIWYKSNYGIKGERIERKKNWFDKLIIRIRILTRKLKNKKQ